MLIAVVDDRGGKFPYNAKALGDILRGDDYRPSAEGATDAHPPSLRGDGGALSRRGASVTSSTGAAT